MHFMLLGRGELYQLLQPLHRCRPGICLLYTSHTPYGDLELACEGLELLLREENTAGQLVLRYRIGTPDGDITVSYTHLIATAVVPSKYSLSPS